MSRSRRQQQPQPQLLDIVVDDKRITPELYTLRETAEKLSISLRTLRRRVDLGLIAIVRMGPRSPRISEREIQRVLRDGAS